MEQKNNDKMIYINDYLSFNPVNGYFELSYEAQEIVYRQKQVICNYSGCVKWGHDFFCELLDLYSGNSKYNYSFGTIIHKQGIALGYKNGRGKEITEWIIKHKDDEWFSKAATMLVNIINDLPKY